MSDENRPRVSYEYIKELRRMLREKIESFVDNDGKEKKIEWGKESSQWITINGKNILLGGTKNTGGKCASGDNEYQKRVMKYFSKEAQKEANISIGLYDDIEGEGKKFGIWTVENRSKWKEGDTYIEKVELENGYKRYKQYKQEKSQNSDVLLVEFLVEEIDSLENLIKRIGTECGGNFIMTEPNEKTVEELIENGVKQIILNGAPGTGKTYTARKIARDMVVKQLEEQLKKDEENKEIDEKKIKDTAENEAKDYIEKVQFHPSYDYTDFVEGLRPVEIEIKDKDGDGTRTELTFKRVDGIFKKFCRKAAEDEKKEKDKEEEKKNKYFFIIDEINRADLSKVFGELMSCLESDKRGHGENGENRIKTQYHNLITYDMENGKDFSKDNDVFFDGFYIPENVYIIGTMNDIDRSVESMDFALRRRFFFKKFNVDINSLSSAFKKGNFNIRKNNEKKPDIMVAKADIMVAKADIMVAKADEIAKQVNYLNKIIEGEGKQYFLNEDYFISQGQFVNIPETCDGYNFEEIFDKVEEEGKKRDLFRKDYNEYKKPDKIEKKIIEKGLLRFVWKYRIEPLLKEYLRGESDIEKFILDCEIAFLAKDNNGEKNSDEK